VTVTDSRRFTDREVALVLKRASEMEESVGDEVGGGSGLSLAELEDIGREVGISAVSLRSAVAGLDRGRGLNAARIAGAPLVQRAVHGIPTRLDEETIRELVAIVDRDLDGAGTVTEALGSVRWTASDRFRSTQVRISPTEGSTAIEVVEKTNGRLRRVMHALPGAWGAMAIMPILSSGATSAPQAVALTGAAVIAGVVAGRAVWTVLARRSAGRVKRLASALAEEATRASDPSV
jgi:hypothetical protein